MFAISWKYVLGRVVARGADDAVEWPVHPARFQQAMVASWGAGGEDPAEHDALRWLERLPPPSLVVPDIGGTTERRRALFVPPNGPSKFAPAANKTGRATQQELRHMPGFRTLSPDVDASLHVGDVTCSLVWPGAEPDPATAAAIRRIVAGVTRVGASESLVRAWVDAAPAAVTHIPAVGSPGTMSLRVAFDGMLDRLVADHAGGADPRSIDQAPSRARYAVVGAPAMPSTGLSMMVWEADRGKHVGPPSSLRRTLPLMAAFRGAMVEIADACGERDLIPAISGHPAGGTGALPDRGADGSDIRHIGYAPLANVADEHADGHLMGLAMTVPTTSAIITDLPARIRRLCQRIMLDNPCGIVVQAVDDHGREFTVRFAWRPETDAAPKRRGLSGSFWSGPSDRWASVTPVVMDRVGRHDDASMAEDIALSCVRQGLPRPIDVTVVRTPWISGTPMSGSFPPVPNRQGAGNRWHTHAVVRFDGPVSGPIVIGAGRYRGYGLFAPFTGASEHA